MKISFFLKFFYKNFFFFAINDFERKRNESRLRGKTGIQRSYISIKCEYK